jgi:hypothetical protein
MRLDDPERPFAAPAVKALLLDGGYVPHLSIIPQSEHETKIIVGLRDYESEALYSYSYKTLIVPTVTLGQLVADYYLDPEATLKRHFNWEPQSAKRKTSLPRCSLSSSDANSVAAALIDLI